MGIRARRAIALIAVCVCIHGCSPATSDTDAAGLDGGADTGSDGSAPVDAPLCATTDEDGDGHASTTCGGDDCDDHDATRTPGAAEVCDGANVDEDCDPTTVGARDVDGDGRVSSACCNVSSTGALRCGDDCDDARRGIGPDSPEVCNDLDDDCDTAIDEGVVLTCWTDADSDRYAPPTAVTSLACECPVRTTPMAPDGTTVDCDDVHADVSPGSPEICSNGRDDDCDSVVDEAGSDWFADCDGDGYGTGTPAHQCTSPGRPPGCTAPGAGYVLIAGDCNDTSVDVHPAASEQCDGSVDHDCDGAIDEAADAASWCNAASRALPHAVAACAAGACVVGSCVSPFIDCSAAPGCELDGSTDPANCGVCGNACTWQRCAASACEPSTITFTSNTTTALLSTGQTTWGLRPVGPTGVLQVSGPCVLRNTGTVSCQDSSAPNYPDVVEVAAAGESGSIDSFESDCVRRRSGEVWCWSFVVPPHRIDGLTAPMALALSDVFGCALEAAGTVSCWGDDSHGELGDGGTTPRASAAPVPGLAGVVEVRTGRASRFACARLATGEVSCWGANSSGQLGSTRTTTTPMLVPGIDDAVSIAVGPTHACAVRATGSVLCWGANGSGQLGTCGSSSSPTPLVVSGIGDALRVYAGASHFVSITCVQRASGPYCFGENNYGNLGVGGNTDSCRPVQVLPPM